ncbi:MAG: sigma-54-dependent Fis family transcriptional regulator [Deltaproteobacteria bacterium]|nr:sigma-54-dependent Fis family transcriptional regulator [Deltaproteobacteria bacterium]
MPTSSKISVEQRLEWYERILSLSRRASDESLESVCRYLMDDAILAAKAELGYFFLITPKGQIHTAYARRQDRTDIPSVDQHFSESVIRRAIEMASPLIVEDASVHPEFREAKSVIAAQIKSLLVLPLFFEKKPIALIYLENKNQAQYFAEELLEVLNLFSSQAAILLHAKMSIAPSKSTATMNEAPILSKNPAMRQILQQADTIANADSTVLLLGETGTGKEVFAKYIHQKSSRAQGPFVAINCSAIPETLMEAELFGYKKGAFTGANADRDGLIRRAHKGTLFLDEIGDLPLMMQAKLLRVLQDKKFTRLGSTVEEESDFRLISATHKPLEDSVSQGFFRQDLYFRINTIALQLLPLRQRTEDILDLAQEFLKNAVIETGRSIKGFSEGAAALLLHYDWPGNIRQLQHAIQRATTLVNADQTNYQFSAEDFKFLSAKNQVSDSMAKLHDAKEEFIRNYVKKAVLIHRGNKSKAAKALGVDPKTLYRHLLEDDNEDKG